MNSDTGPDKKEIHERDVAPGVPKYDPGIVPAETGARMDREGEKFMKTPTKESDEAAKTDDQTDDGSIEVDGGFTVDKEGLQNNYAIEPEMYVNEPGDLRQKEEEAAAERAAALNELKQDETGKLTTEEDARGKGPGIV